MKRRIPIPIAAALAALAILSGCGGASGSSSDEAATTTATVPGGGSAEDVKVIGTWVDALREGHVREAAASFALPSVVANGTKPIRLKTREDAVVFNESLPCGAKLVSASTEGQVTTATFELTERPGGSCGDGVGLEAKTAFVIADGKIVHWSRVPGPDDGPAPSGQLS
jgi:hypothetical protein